MKTSFGRFTFLSGLLVAAFATFTVCPLAASESNGSGSRGGGGGVFLADGSFKFISLLKSSDAGKVVDRDFLTLQGASKVCQGVPFKPYSLPASAIVLLKARIAKIVAKYPDLGKFLDESIAQILSEAILIPYSLDESPGDHTVQIGLENEINVYLNVLLDNAELYLPNRQVLPPGYGGKSDGRRSLLDWVGMVDEFTDPIDGGDRRWPELREPFNGMPIEKQHTVVFYAGAIALVSEPLVRLMDDESLAALFLHEGLRFMFNRELSNTESLSDHETQGYYLHTTHEAVPLLLSLDSPARLAQILPKEWLGNSGHFHLSSAEITDYRFIKGFFNAYAPRAFGDSGMKPSCQNAESGLYKR